MRPDELLGAVQDILFREWDPIGVNGNEQCRDEYNSYAPTIRRYLREGIDEYRLSAHLDELMRSSMGLSVRDVEHNRRVARLLIALRRS